MKKYCTIRLLSLIILGVLQVLMASAQDRIITGKVTDALGEALPGVTITSKGTTKGTSSDSEGKFELAGVSENATLVFSYIGFETQEMLVGNRSQFEIKMVEENQTLSEVVVVGYGTQRKSHMTGSIAKVTNENLNQIPVARADQALIGKMAGVQIQTSNAQSGSAPTIQIRGAASITAGTSPLIVVDGYPVPTDLSAIDMNDVESIEVLKDAASAAIYGSRGANGVIIVTTKSGKSGKTKISFNISGGTKETVKRLDIPSLDEWVNFVKEDNNEVLSDKILLAQKYDANTDPQDLIFRKGNFQNYQVNARGGNDNAKFYVSAGVLKDKGVVLSNDYTKFNLRANVDFKLGNRVQMGVSINPSYAKQNETPISIHDGIRSIAPWMPLYHNEATSLVSGKPVGSNFHQRDFDPTRNSFYKATGLANVSATGDNNGYIQIKGQNKYNTELRTLTNTFVNWDILEGLSFRTSLGVYTRQLDNYFYRTSWARVDELIQGTAAAKASTLGQYSNSRIIDWLNENVFSYKKSIGKHQFDAIAGWTAQGTVTNTASASASNFATDNIETLNAGTATALSTLREQNRLLSALARVNYSFNDTYLVSIGSRWDGSSRFGADNRWGYFPSASLGWRVSQMPFLVHSQTVSDLKIRASYGATGNNNIGNYRAFATVSPSGAILGSNEAVVPGFNVSSYANSNLGWERTFSVNGGIDLGLFNDRLRATVDVYESTTDQLLLYLPISGVTGFDGYWVNRGKVSNRGMELELTGRIIAKPNFSWTTNVVAAKVKNELKDFGGSQQLISNGDTKRNNYFLARVGEPLVQFYGYETVKEVSLKGTDYWPIGVAAERIFVKDIDGNGVIDVNDRKVLGSPYPKITWGLTNTIKYKAFDMSMVWQGSHGAKIYNIDPNYYETQYATASVSSYLNYTPEEQAFTRVKTETDYNVQDASYVALRNLNIGYTVPVEVSKKIGLSGLRIYASSSNLIFSMAKDYTSLNPEGISPDFESDPLKKGWQKGAYPIARTLTLGINIDL
ncbi:TonB-linked SusC/RagA family outer membrane protein [Dyadobacter jejuensis]|uniref:TonB-linked SusC/RagA family outer membrane protein n=1 Tax=Dyadobacter jejuensis TaxID=1082580 RepID=A0A316AME4_9BACT|nr:TonB-dependent receptor [Dyadobacter jejuensis]PWJ58459.1 TonB-linked SusC/RagA family outer membrane protein [Dyadobacter jejuensis]